MAQFSNEIWLSFRLTQAEVRINSMIQGVILSDQIRSIDWKSRNAAFIEKTSEEILKEILENIDLLLNE